MNSKTKDISKYQITSKNRFRDTRNLYLYKNNYLNSLNTDSNIIYDYPFLILLHILMRFKIYFYRYFFVIYVYILMLISFFR